MEQIISLYKQLTGTEPRQVAPLSESGSNRRYFRLTGGAELSDLGAHDSLIAVVGTDRDENRAFISLSRSFIQSGLPVPKVHAVSDDQMCYLQEDLGDTSLYSFIAEGRGRGGDYSAREVQAIRAAIRLLPSFQFMPVRSGRGEEVFSACYPQREIDRESVMFDLNYFKYCFLKLQGVEFNEHRLQHDFDALVNEILADSSDTFLYRDFQSRNVMLRDGQPYFIDFQGGRRGPIHYDVASFLWQSSARFSDALRHELIGEYLDALQPFVRVDATAFERRLHLFVFFRILQVLGAYGFRGLWEKKRYFIDSIPTAIANLQKEILQGTADAYPYLREVCLAVVSREREKAGMDKADERGKAGKSGAEEQGSGQKVAQYLSADKTYLATGGKKPLVVTVYSFSFKRGIPADESGNGGGYVFDCRSTHNPGRYDEYKPLTGLDQPVIDFLEADGEILTFLDSVYRLVDFHVGRFLDRGFTHMQVSFGCTGGRHRSVYCAQHTAEHLYRKYGVEVHVIHREQNITQVLTNKSQHGGK